MRGIQHGTGDKRAEKAPAAADIPKQAKVGSPKGNTPKAATKPKKKS